ncbi:MAG TPA: S53 family peptidase [Candidatus Angelobacter sp.]|nr:S53 family peptidase [Candidatus Angelobacter sp.]
MARTNLRVWMPETGPMAIDANARPNELPPVPGLFFETPASLACVYRLVAHPMPGCNPDQTTQTVSGGSGAIAIVDAFDDPNAASDLAIFSLIFGLPPADLTVVFASGTQPPLDPSGGWELEESLDMEYAHAMAPGARLFLVEAASNRGRDILAAIGVASNLVAANGGGEVTMSFSFGEFPQETQLDGIFTTPGVVYLASSGDGPGANWPATSPNVVAAGGTTISRNSSTGNFILENTWQDAGGGPSLFETRPHFQDRIAEIVGAARGTPDLSFDANPSTGVWLVDTNLFQGQPGGFFIVGGTSLSSPALAGIINNAGKFVSSSQAENTRIYRHLFSDRDDFRDIVFGNCGLNIGDFADFGWDFCTGVGSVHGLGGE